MLKEDIKKGETYWCCHTSILTEYPKQVTVTDIWNNVVVFDQFVGQEKYANLTEICKGLFLEEDDAKGLFVNMMNSEHLHFIEEDEFYEAFANDIIHRKPHLFL